MTEWFAEIGQLEESAEFRKEDNEKTERLSILNRLIGVPFRAPKVFTAREMQEKSDAVRRLLQDHGSERCAFRLIPNTPDLPKLRNRGLSIAECYEQWFRAQEIDLDSYTVHVFPDESDIRWSIFLVIKEDALFGEIAKGTPYQLSQGILTGEAYRFFFDYQTWQWSAHNEEAIAQVERMVAHLHVAESVRQDALCDAVNAMFSNNYLLGYFEAVVPGDDLYFFDFNRMMPRSIPTPAPHVFIQQGGDSAELKGVSAFSGIARGLVCRVTDETVSSLDFPEGAILVCVSTDVRYVPLMKRAGAIITDTGGILSHPAIIARELKKPCIIGTGNATSVISDGDIVEVDADRGVVRILEKRTQ